MKLPTLKIGKLKLKNPLILAPMVDVTDLPYRILCEREGAALTFTEMLYVDAILHDNPKTLNLMKRTREEGFVGLQITGNGIEEFEKFVQSGKWKDFDLIDLNCGCPSIRITGNEAGSYLLRNPEKIAKIIKILKLTKKPITVKIRLGFHHNNVLSVAKVVEKAGAAALTVHGRLAIHGRDVPADWKEIARVKKELKIPVIGNGDVFSGEDARKMLEICDGVMIARGAIGDPGIFSRVLKYLEECPPARPASQHSTTRPQIATKVSAEKKIISKKTEEVNVRGFDDNNGFDAAKNIKLYLEYLRLERKYYGSEVDLGRVKYLGGKFLRGLQGAAALRAELMGLKNIEEIENFVAGLETKKNSRNSK